MAYTLSRNLRLRLDSNLTANARFNLETLDSLGGTFIVDSTDTLQIRSRGDIAIAPESADLGGSGTGGTVSIGSVDQPVTLSVFTGTLNYSGPLGLLDQATGGTKYLRFSYNSATTGAADTMSDRALVIDLEGADRQFVLGGNLSTSGGSLALSLIGATSLSLPVSGTVSTLSGTEVLTNKTISASQNTITGITNANLSGSAGITYSNLSLTGSIVNTDISGSAAVSYSKLNLTGSLVDSDISASAAVSRLKIATGTANHLIINDASGFLSSTASLGISQGGTGAASAAAGLNNLLPSQAGNNGRTLTTDGSNASWTVGGTGTVRSYSTSWTTANGTSKVVTHSLGTKDVSVIIRDESDEVIGVSTVIASSTSAVTLTSSEAPAIAWTVVVLA